MLCTCTPTLYSSGIEPLPHASQLPDRFAHRPPHCVAEAQAEMTIVPPLKTDLRKLGQVLILFFGLLAARGSPLAAVTSGSSYDVTLNAKMLLTKAAHPPQNYARIVAWLVPVGPYQVNQQKLGPICIAQHNKMFEPDLLVLQVGSSIQLCNRDSWVHKPVAFSNGLQLHFTPGQPGRYKTLQFNHPGVIYLFCELHPQMSAVVLAVESPYFGVSDRRGLISIRSVPAGTYSLHVWSELGVTSVLSRRIILPGSNCKRPAFATALAKHTTTGNQNSPQPNTGGTP